MSCYLPSSSFVSVLLKASQGKVDFSRSTQLPRQRAMTSAANTEFFSLHCGTPLVKKNKLISLKLIFETFFQGHRNGMNTEEATMEGMVFFLTFFFLYFLLFFYSLTSFIQRSIQTRLTCRITCVMPRHLKLEMIL